MLSHVRRIAASRVMSALGEIQLHGPCSALFTVLLHMN